VVSPGDQRQAGVLLHLTSLPGPEGVGSLGADARRFVDLIAAAGFTTWQVLPVNPPGPGFSPYAASSSFAGSPLLISVAELAGEGLLASEESRPPSFPSEAVVPEAVAAWKEGLFRRAFRRALREGAFRAFVDSPPAWLDDWVLFAALRSRLGEPWQRWPQGLARRDAGALRKARDELGDEIAYQAFLQWCFERQWTALRTYARRQGVRVFGDMPIFPALQSADVWASQESFKLDGRGWPRVVAGVPPDLFSATGQRWGNPHYRWRVEQEQGFPYWTGRIARAFELYDMLRIDHFRGFVAAWEIPAGEATAIRGRWVRGPGRALFDALVARLGPLDIVVEDLGVITPDVVQLRESLGYPGMIVLQFAFDGSPDNPYLPRNHRENAVVYAGTHDNDTTVGWWASLGEGERERVRALSGRPFTDPAGDMSAMALESPVRLAVLTMQDILRLGSEARMNTPGHADGNWRWRFRWEQVPGDLATGLRELLVDARRAHGPERLQV
jgi:4-alpha-glucanotransferase